MNLIFYNLDIIFPSKNVFAKDDENSFTPENKLKNSLNSTDTQNLGLKKNF